MKRFDSLMLGIMAILIVVCSCSVRAQGSLHFVSRRVSAGRAAQDLPLEPVNRLINIYKNKLHRYMEDDRDGCDDVDPRTYQDWKDFHLKRCSYEQFDRRGLRGPIIGTKHATVVMMNPPIEMLSRWVVATCVIVRGHARPACTDSLMNHLIGASNTQFAVAGVVQEDQFPYRSNGTNGDGIVESYIFRDGVTVSIQGGFTSATIVQPTETQIQNALAPTPTITRVFRFARIQSTCREQYVLYERDRGMTPENVEGQNWLKVVRTLYQDAWQRAQNPSLPENVEKYRNDLMVATWAHRAACG